MERAFESIFREGRKPLRLQTDDGKEFYNKTVTAFLQRRTSFISPRRGIPRPVWWNGLIGPSKNGSTVILQPRTRLTIRKLYLMWYEATTPLLTAASVWHPIESPWATVPKYGKRCTVKDSKRSQAVTLRVGDRVRLNKKFHTFKKGYLPGWTEEVFVVDKVKPGPVPTYKIIEWDGTPLAGTFYNQDLQKVEVSDDTLFRIEKVMQRKGNKLLVCWKGWPQKYDSWIDKTSTHRLKPRKKHE